MQIARKRSASLPTRRRCCACQQKHIKCEYEKGDEKCKACRTNDRKCVVKHRFQHVNPAVKRARKRADSSRSKDSARSVDEDSSNDPAAFAIIDWALPEYQPTPIAPAVEDSPEHNDADADADADQNFPSSRHTQEQQIEPSQPTDDSLTITLSPTHRRPLNVTSDFTATLHSTASNLTNASSSNSNNNNRTQIPSPLLQFASPTVENFSTSPNVLDTIFSPGAFSASAIPHASPLSAVGSVPTPGDSRMAEKEKAFLLRHFTDVLWKWFDVCDPEQHFRRIVPVQALKCPTLMKAICASSAWHLCRKGKYDKERSNYLYENCLTHLIKAMDSPNVGSDDSILIAATIMHNVEELRDLEHTLVLESRGHLVGINIFLDSSSQLQPPNQAGSTSDSQVHTPSVQHLSPSNSATNSNGPSDWPLPINQGSSLRQAALRVAMREELHTCFINQQPLTLPASLTGIDRSFTPASDETWAWRVMLIYRDALADSLQPSTAADWDRIFNDLQSWYNLKPDSFEPTFYSDPDPAAASVGGSGSGTHTSSPSSQRCLPEMWFLHDSHVIGTIHYHLARIVLATSNPRTPKIGWNRAAALRKVDREVRADVIRVAGIALSNCLLPSAMTAATMVITMCAECLAGDSAGSGSARLGRSGSNGSGRNDSRGSGTAGSAGSGPVEGNDGLEGHRVTELQAALFEVFTKAKEIHGWPTEASQAYVRSVWYGESSSVSGNDVVQGRRNS